MAPSYALDDALLLGQCRVETFRSHGPGGQHANRTDSAVRLTHAATGLQAQCQDHRQRDRNQADALRRLRLRLALAERGGADPRWLAPYRHARRLALGAKARDFHLAVAVVLDALAAKAGSLADAAADLDSSTSQLARLLTADKEAHQAANALRARFGQGPVR